MSSGDSSAAKLVLLGNVFLTTLCVRACNDHSILIEDSESFYISNAYEKSYINA